MMKKYIIIAFITMSFLINNVVMADNYINIETTYVNKKEGSGIDPMVILTLGGLNMDISQDIFEKATWELSYGFGSKTNQKISGERYDENHIFNVAINLPVTNKVYTKVGLGGWWSHINNESGNNESETFTPVVKIGAGYMINQSIPVNMNMHIGSNNLSLGIGYIF